MCWNWQQPDWPHFTWTESRLTQAEERFRLGSGVLFGTITHLGEGDRHQFTVESMTTEAATTSEIEGEILDRESVQSSIRRQLGLTNDHRRVSPAEAGISELMVDLYRGCTEPLSEHTLCRWHRMVCKGRTDLRDVGRYRTHPEPMRVVSGRVDAPTVHFEAPPSARVGTEVSRYIEWFNSTGSGGSYPLPAMTRAGLAHLYFESIHPFEDGNGRIGRAIAERALCQVHAPPFLTALAPVFLANRTAYYDALEAANKSNEVTDWLAWIAGITLEAQERTLAQVKFLVEKTKLLDRFGAELNDRQHKVLLRMFREGPDGFRGGLSAGNYLTIAKTSTATATRDLSAMVERGVLLRAGERRHARYTLPIPMSRVARYTVGEGGEVFRLERPEG